MGFEYLSIFFKFIHKLQKSNLKNTIFVLNISLPVPESLHFKISVQKPDHTMVLLRIWEFSWVGIWEDILGKTLEKVTLMGLKIWGSSGYDHLFL